MRSRRRKHGANPCSTSSPRRGRASAYAPGMTTIDRDHPSLSPTEDLLVAARAIHGDVVAIPRRIHRRPEIALDLPGETHLRPGPEMGATDVIRITVHGRGGHASEPQSSLDPIVVAAEIVLALQAMVTRRIDVFDPAVVTIAQITAGTTNNIIP